MEHLGFRWVAVAIEFTVTDAKQENVRANATSLLKDMAKGRSWVSRRSLRSAAGVANSLHLALPLALFYTRSVHDVLNDWSEEKKHAAHGADMIDYPERMDAGPRRA